MGTSFYIDIFSVVITYGYMSDSFNIEQRVTQGYPLSTTVFIICKQTLIMNLILKNPYRLKAIKLNKLTLQLMELFNNKDKDSFEELFNIRKLP